jgi:excisionase family DNA binding protein
MGERIFDKAVRVSSPRTCEDFVAFDDMATGGVIRVDGMNLYCTPTSEGLADIARRIVALEAALGIGDLPSAAEHDGDEWLTVPQACAEMKVGQRTLRRWIAEGRLPAYRMGDSLIRIKASDLDGMYQAIPTAGTR